MSLRVIVPSMIFDGIILDRESSISLRQQLAGHLESRILGGQIGPGRRLPSVRRTEEILGLHRNTVAAAYRDLVQAGLARTRPGSGVYVRSPAPTHDRGVAKVIVHGSRDVGLLCTRPDLRVVLSAELRSRLAVRVHRGDSGGPSVTIRLALGVAFLQVLRELPRPSLVSVFSGSDRVHRLVSIAVQVHGGDGIAYLPSVPGNRSSVERTSRLATLIAADYAALPWARHRLPADVLPVPLISSVSWSALALLLRRSGARSHGVSPARRRLERSLQTSVQEP